MSLRSNLLNNDNNGRRSSRGGAPVRHANGEEQPRGVRFDASLQQQQQQQQENDHGCIPALLLDVVTGLVACWCALGLMTILAMLYVAVRPFGLAPYRRLAASWGAGTFLDAVSVLLLPGCRICVTGDSELFSNFGSSVILSNHVTEADWWALFLLGRCLGLRGSLKVFMRNEYLHLNLGDEAENGSPREGRTTNSNNGHGNGHASSVALAVVPPNESRHNKASPDIALVAKLLHMFLEFPLISGDDSSSDRKHLHELLRSFTSQDTMHLLFYPEGWSIHNGADRQSVHQKSNQFAVQEGKPQLKHLLLPRTRGFHASLECLRETNPLVYDVTMAYSGYDGSLPSKVELSMTMLWNILRRKFPKEVHLRIKRYSLEEVLQDPNWLYKKWAEKDRALAYFVRKQQFQNDNRGYGRLCVFEPRNCSVETSIIALCRLMLLPCAVPFLLLMSVPLFWTLLLIWLGQRAYHWAFPNTEEENPPSNQGQQTPGSAAPTTPFLPATPFVSPSPFAWRDMFSPK